MSLILDTVQDQTVKKLIGGICAFVVEVPADVALAIATSRKPPSVAVKPGIRGLRCPGQTATEGIRKAADVVLVAVWVGEEVIVAAADIDAIGSATDDAGACPTVDKVLFVLRFLIYQTLQFRIKRLTLFVDHVDHG